MAVGEASRADHWVCGGHARLHINDVGPGQTFFVASLRRALPAGEATLELYSRIAEAVQWEGLHIVHERIFGSHSVESEVLRARRAPLDFWSVDSRGPLTYIEGRPVWGEGLAGAVIYAVAPASNGEEPWLIYDGHKPCGRGWRQGGATYFALQDLKTGGTVRSHRSSRPRQVEALLQRARRLLREQEADYADVARTWFYLQDIVDWYDEFNRARNAKYEEFGIMPSDRQSRLMLPASTAVCGKNSENAAAVLDLLAIAPAPGQGPPFEQLSSVGQIDAFRYGSAFSRGALIAAEGSSHIALSGTAAIDENGASLFVGDPSAQMACALDKAGVLTASHGAALSNTAAAVCYLKHPEHAELFWREAANNGLKDLPAVCIVADICREELLFEMEAVVAID